MYHSYVFYSPVLASSCPALFRRILPDPLPLAGGQIALDDVKPEVMDVLLTYIYSAELRLRDDTVAGVVDAAARWRLPAACLAGCDYLRRRLQPHSALGCVHFARALLKQTQDAAVERLYRDARQYIAAHLTQVLCEDEFVEIASKDDIVMTILANRASCTLSFALEKTLKWYYRNQAARQTDVVQLIAGLCLLYCRQDFAAITSAMKARVSVANERASERKNE